MPEKRGLVKYGIIAALERIATALERAYPVPPKTPVGARVKAEIRQYILDFQGQKPAWWEVTADEMAAIRAENPGLKPDSKISFLGVPLRVKPDE